MNILCSCTVDCSFITSTMFEIKKLFSNYRKVNFFLYSLQTSCTAQHVCYTVLPISANSSGNSSHIEPRRPLKKFLLGYAECNGMLLPGRIPGYKRTIYNYFRPQQQRKYTVEMEDERTQPFFL